MKKAIAVSLLMIGVAGGGANASSDHQTKAQICAGADIVAIGKVTDVDSEWEQTGLGYIITSEVTFDVERLIHGPSLSTVGVYVFGGKVGDLEVNVGGAPRFNPNERYLLLLHVRQGEPATLHGAGAGAIRLNPSAALPSEAELIEEYEENCDE